MMPPDAPLLPVSRCEVERAARLMRNHPDTRILNARIEPHWIAGGTAFWYRRELAEGQEHMLVDARSGIKCAAFDHQRVAAALAVVAGCPIDPAGLRLLAIADERATLEVGGDLFACALDGTSCDRLARPDPRLLFCPAGSRAVFLRDGNLWLREPTGEERPLTDDGAPQFGYGFPSDRFDQNKLVRDRMSVALPPVQTWWSPDGRRIVTARLDQRGLAAYPYLELAPADGSFRPRVHDVRLPLMGEPAGVLDWWVIDVDSGQRRPLAFPVDRMTAANNGIDDLKIGWAGGGDTLLAISAMTGLVGGEAFAVDLATGAVRVILQDLSTPGHPLVAGGYGSPIARFIADGRELLWWSEADRWGHLYRYDVATGALLNRVTDGDWLVRDIVAVDNARGEIWFTGMGRDGAHPYHRHLYRCGLDGRGLTLLSPETGDHLIVDPTGSALVFDVAGPTAVVAPDFASYCYDVSSIAEPTRTLLRARDGSLITEVERADATGLYAAGYRPPDEVSGLAADGQSVLHGLVYRPPDGEPGRRYPVLDVEYANPAVAITPRHFAHAATFAGTAATPAALAALGFIVVMVDARGTPYRGQAFSQPSHDYLREVGLDDHIAFIRDLAARNDTLDLDRVGIAGQSFGGYAAVAGMLEHPTFFKAAVAGAPQLAYHNMAAEAVLTCSRGAPLYANGTASRSAADERPVNFADLDLAERLDRLAGPILIVAGALDENVYPGTVMQFFDRAVADDRDVELIWLPGAAHDALFTPHALRRSLDFLLRHLQGRMLPTPCPPLPPPRRGRQPADRSY